MDTKYFLVQEKSEEEIALVVELLQKEELFISSTDTVFGVGGVTTVRVAEKIYLLKNRNSSLPLTVLISSIDEILPYVELSADILSLLSHFWAGALTAVFELKCKPPWLEGSFPHSLGLRIPQHLVLLRILQKLGRPLFMSSANLSGDKPACTIEEVQKVFDKKVSCVVYNTTESTLKPSTVVDFRNIPPKILREGAISRELLEPFFTSIC